MNERVVPTPEAMAVDGEKPKEVWAVETEEQLVEAIHKAQEDSLALIPLGNGTKRHIGLPPVRYDISLWLRPMSGIVEYSPEDLVVIVRTGTTLTELQEVLAERGQFLPIDPPFPETATVGGIIATASTGPSRCLYGAVREHLLGVKVAQPNGNITRFGGKVVKNVAGYDMTKLYVGSFGTLGVIVEAAFKVRPLPEHKATLILWNDDLDKVESFLGQLVLSDVASVFAELLNEGTMEQIGFQEISTVEAPYCLLLGFDGFREEVDWWLNESKRIASEAGLLIGSTFEGDLESAIRAKVRDAHAGANANLVLKVMLPSSEVCSFVKEAQEIFGEACGTIAHSLNGILRVMVRGEFAEANKEAVQSLLERAIQRDGNLIVEKAPRELKSQLPVWGKPNESWTLMRRLKETLDPKNIFSPGRMF
ncbi:MAG: FAD-binding oxidoreductase [Armatimonadota bacterium]|nr:FAD-binding oxidoreductase [Armatimonadota bacterium]MDW8142158.1 FAD-binding oxidoreductase [Armatimonadota bacterium]